MAYQDESIKPTAATTPSNGEADLSPAERRKLRAKEAKEWQGINQQMTFAATKERRPDLFYKQAPTLPAADPVGSLIQGHDTRPWNLKLNFQRKRPAVGGQRPIETSES